MGSPKKKTPRSSALIGLRIATFADAAIAQLTPLEEIEPCERQR
jgi:hypothetical protein